MRCELVVDVAVERFAVFAEMARLERRPELGALCRAARDGGGRIDERVVEQVLPGLGSAGRDNIVAWCRTIGLCDRQGALTTLGREVAESGEAPVPEQGVFELWAVKHPLLGARILHVGRLKSSRDGRFQEMEPVPIEPERDRVFSSVVDPTARWILRGLPGNGGAACLRRSERSTCRVRWTIDFMRREEHFRLEGSLDDGQRRPFQHKPEPSRIDLDRLLDDWTLSYLSRYGTWTNEKRLAVAFDALPEAAQESFRHTYALGSVEALDRGSFTGVELRDVPIGPRARADAERWARARLDRKLRTERGYHTRADLRRLFARLVDETPLAAHQPSLPAHAAAIQDYHAEPEIFFNLAAPVDLSPFEIDAAELDAARLPVQAEPGRVRDGVVRIPYRGTVTMIELIDRLLHGRKPRRVLLCDRYVRTPEQLGALKLLHAAFKLRHPDAKLEVVTEAAQEPDNLEPIRGILGSPPRLYKNLFNGPRKHQPHARYLLIEPFDGHGFGWQMDNSPLDAGVAPGANPHSSLKWRDFGAFRLDAGELPDALQRWFEGGTR